MNKFNNKEQIEKAINKLPYSLGCKAKQMVAAYENDKRDEYISLANQFDSENAEKSQDIAEWQRVLKHSKEFASLIIPYIQVWLAKKPQEKTDKNPNLVAEKVVGNQKVASASSKSKAK